MVDVKAVMSRKVAGMPVGLWVLGVGGGLAAAYYLRSHSSSSDSAAAIDGATTDPGVSETDGTGGAATSEPYYSGSGAGSSGGTADIPAGDDYTADTSSDGTYDYAGGGYDDGTSSSVDMSSSGGGGNKAWRVKAVNAATAGGAGGLFANRAIDRYLAGQSLNKRQAKLVSKVIGVTGVPPKPTPVPKVNKGRKVAANPQHVKASAGHTDGGRHDAKRPQQQPQNVGQHPFHQVKPNNTQGVHPAAQQHRDTGAGVGHGANGARTPQPEQRRRHR